MGKQSPVAIAAAVAGVLALGLAGYFLIISPQRGKSAELTKEIASTQAQIEQYRSLERESTTTAPIRVADLFRLTKAMPDAVDMTGVILELSRVAREAGIQFDSITPQGAAVVSGYSSIPITLVFDGNYYQLSDFLFRLRNLVRVHSGRLDAQGRLFVVDSIGFSESEKAFPQIKATLVAHAFTFGDAAALQAAGAPPAATTEPATTSAETTETAPAAPPAATTPATTTQESHKLISPSQPPAAAASATGAAK